MTVAAKRFFETYVDAHSGVIESQVDVSSEQFKVNLMNGTRRALPGLSLSPTSVFPGQR